VAAITVVMAAGIAAFVFGMGSPEHHQPIIIKIIDNESVKTYYNVTTYGIYTDEIYFYLNDDQQTKYVIRDYDRYEFGNRSFFTPIDNIIIFKNETKIVII